MLNSKSSLITTQQSKRFQTSVISIVLSFSLLGCVSKPQAPTWAFEFSFEDESSCSLYREVEVFDSGRILYFPPAARDVPRSFQVDPERVTELVNLVKSFPLTDAGYLEDFVGRNPRGAQGKGEGPKIIAMKKRGSSSEMARLATEIAKASGIEWERIVPTASRICVPPRYPLPAGTINLRGDLQ